MLHIEWRPVNQFLCKVRSKNYENNRPKHGAKFLPLLLYIIIKYCVDGRTSSWKHVSICVTDLDLVISAEIWDSGIMGGLTSSDQTRPMCGTMNRAHSQFRPESNCFKYFLVDLNCDTACGILRECNGLLSIHTALDAVNTEHGHDECGSGISDDGNVFMSKQSRVWPFILGNWV